MSKNRLGMALMLFGLFFSIWSNTWGADARWVYLPAMVMFAIGAGLYADNENKTGKK